MKNYFLPACAFLLFVIDGCSKYDTIVLPMSSKHYIGEKYGGGVIFELHQDPDGSQHGLIVSTHDLSLTAPWGSNGIFINGAGSSWDGAQNTQSIVSSPSVQPGDAALLCDQYEAGGFTDWYLPAVDQLNTLDNVAYEVNEALTNDTEPYTDPLTSGAADFYYWSSTQYDYGMAGGFKYVEALASKTKLWGVRAIRSF